MTIAETLYITHWMVRNGILNGRGENLLVPGDTASRAELAAILHRIQ